MTARSFLSSVEQAQQTGTLEVLLTASTAPVELITLSSASDFAGNLTNLLIYLVAGVAVFRASIHPNLLSCIAVLLLALVIALAIGILASTLQIAFHKGSALLWLLSSGLWFLSGAMFPVSSLPRPLEFLAQFNPLVYAIEGMRRALLGAEPISAISGTLVRLAAFGAVLLPSALAALSLSIRSARRNGTLSFY
jgi:ABC-2 type transport system permease protein